MRTHRFFLILLGSCLAGAAHAAEAPADPQLASLPTRTTLSKSFNYPQTSPNANLTEEEKKRAEFEASLRWQLDQSELAKDGEVKRETQRFTNGKQVEVWKMGEFSFIVNSWTPNQILVLSPHMTSEETILNSFGKSEFDELSWINRDSFRGDEVRQGVKCYVYKSGDMTAWLDQSSRLPAFFQSGKMQVSYTYKPSGPLSLPDKFKKKFEDVRKSWAGAH